MAELPASTRASARGASRGRPGYDLDTLLRAAAEAFHERGYEGTSMEDLAGRLGITKSAIYYHVASKEELLRRSVNHALDALFAVLEEPEACHGPAIDRLHHVVFRSVEVLAAELPAVTLLLRVRGNSVVEREVLARRRELDHQVAGLVTDAVREASVRPDIDPELASKLAFGTVNSLIEWYRPGRDWSPDQLASALTSVIFDGLRA